MTVRWTNHLAGLGLAIAALTAAPAQAASITVINPSFETLPAGGLTSGGCGAGCSYSITAIPGWVNSGGTNGQFQPGSSSGNHTYFDYIPDGSLTVAYTNGGSISQTLGATAVAGRTYTLTTDFGVRHDTPNPGSITLTIGLANIVATGAIPPSGGWSTYTATYTATGADAGGAIRITLDSPGGQGDFDHVQLSGSTVPEPASWGLMLVGFGMVGVAARGRHRTALAA